MVRRSVVALWDGQWEWRAVFLQVPDGVSHSHWTAYGYSDMPHHVPASVTARDLWFAFRCSPCHAVYFHGREMEYDAVFASVDEDEPLIEIMSDKDEDGQSSDGGRIQDRIDMRHRRQEVIIMDPDKELEWPFGG